VGFIADAADDPVPYWLVLFIVEEVSWIDIWGGPKIGTIFIRLNFTKYKPIFKIIPLSESEENL